MVAIAGIAIGAIGLISSIMAASNNAEASKYAVDKQIAIANRIRARDDELFELWWDEYLGCELMYAAGVCSDRSLVVDLNTAAVRATVTVKRQFARMARDSVNCLPVYCAGAETGVIRAAKLAEATATTWAVVTARRAEQERVEIRNQQNRENKWRIAAQGHGAYFNTAGSALAAETFGKIAQAHERAAGEASRAAGYYTQQVVSGVGRLANQNSPLIDNRSPPPDAGRPLTITNNVIVPDSNQRRNDDPTTPLFDDSLGWSD